MLKFEFSDAALNQLGDALSTNQINPDAVKDAIREGLIAQVNGRYVAMPNDTFDGAYAFRQGCKAVVAAGATLTRTTSIAKVSKAQENWGVSKEFGDVVVAGSIPTSVSTVLGYSEPADSITAEFGGKVSIKGVVVTPDMCKVFEDVVGASFFGEPIIQEPVQEEVPVAQEGTQEAPPEVGVHELLDIIGCAVTGMIEGESLLAPTVEPVVEKAVMDVLLEETIVAEIVEPSTPPAIAKEDVFAWERTIGDLPQAFERLRIHIDSLVQLNMEEHLFKQIYTAANNAKSLGRTAMFLDEFDKLPREMAINRVKKTPSPNIWFEKWLNLLTMRINTFDGSEQVQLVIRELYKLAPDNAKDAITKCVEVMRKNGEVSRLPDAYKRYLTALDQRMTILMPVSFIVAAAEQINAQVLKEQARPPMVHKSIVAYAMTLQPSNLESIKRSHDKLADKLPLGGICMDTLTSEWECAPGVGVVSPFITGELLRYMEKNGIKYASTEEAVLKNLRDCLLFMLTWKMPETEYYLNSLRDYNHPIERYYSDYATWIGSLEVLIKENAALADVWDIYMATQAGV